MPTAILFANDWMALGGITELHRLGFEIPRDISVIGHDNLGLCTEIRPQLTSIDRRVDQVIMQALTMLRAQIDSGQDEPQQRYVPAELVWRESTGACPSR